MVLMGHTVHIICKKKKNWLYVNEEWRKMVMVVLKGAYRERLPGDATASELGA